MSTTNHTIEITPLDEFDWEHVRDAIMQHGGLNWQYTGTGGGLIIQIVGDDGKVEQQESVLYPEIEKAIVNRALVSGWITFEGDFDDAARGTYVSIDLGHRNVRADCRIR